MDSRSVEYGGLALLGVLAIALAAASLPAMDRGAGAGLGPPGTGDGDGRAPATGATDAYFDLAVLDAIGWLLLALAAVSTLGYLAVYWPRVLATVVVAAVVITVAFAFARFLPAVFTPAELPDPWLPSGGPVGGGGGDGPANIADQVMVPVIGLLLALAAAAGVALVRVRRAGTDRRPRVDPSNATDVGRAAGRIADRLEEGTDLDNEIYRSWHEMTLLLDPSGPSSTTPGEFAARAADEGMNRDDVDELTRLFERVRYGGHEPTGADRRLAVIALRRIEATHADDGR